MIGIIGGGMGGLFAARMLARLGREVTVFEVDPPYPTTDTDTAFLDWQRPGVSQLRQPHSARSVIRKLLRQEDPELLGDLIAAGMVEWPFHLLGLKDDEIPHDPELVCLLGRRSAFEIPLRARVERTPGVTIRRGVIRGLAIDRSGPRPRVTGVNTDAGTESFECVIEASGRRSRIGEWIEAAGSPRPHEEVTECGITYYSQYFRFKAGVELPRGPYPSGPSGMAPGVHYTMNRTDARTFSVMLGVAASSDEFRSLRHQPVFLDFVRSLPGADAWLSPDVSEPLRKVEPFAGLTNRYRRFHTDDGPLVQDLYVVGDARFVTNPFYGWGVAFALRQSLMLRDAFVAHADPAIRNLEYERAADRFARTYFDAATHEDAAKLSVWRSDWPIVDRGEPGSYRYYVTTVLPAIYKDQWIFRKISRRSHLLDHPEDVVGDPQVLERAARIGAKLGTELTAQELRDRARRLAEKHVAT